VVIRHEFSEEQPLKLSRTERATLRQSDNKVLKENLSEIGWYHPHAGSDG